MSRSRSKPGGRGRRQPPPPALRVARSLWSQQRFEEAISKFNEAVRAAPNDWTVLIDASRALGARYQRQRSRNLLERALRLGARRVEVQRAAGESYRMLGLMAEAEACYRRACLLADDPASQLELARICERRHLLEEAEKLVGKVRRQVPNSAAVHLLGARLARRRGEFDRAESMLRDVVRRAAGDDAVRAEAGGDLALLLDAAGRYDEAWESALACKSLLLPHDQAHWQATQFVLQRCREMVEAITPSHWQRWVRPAPDENPGRVALLTGFPRSGTTLLEQLLDTHPEVVCSEEREVFAAETFPSLGGGHAPEEPILEVLNRLTPAQIEDARRQYLLAMEALLGESIGPRWHVDKNPSMNLMIPAMRRVFPELQIIVALRDPRDVVLSCFLRYLPLNRVSVSFLTLERTVDRYLLDLRAWLKMRPMLKEGAVEVRYEDTVADLPREARRVFASLALPWDEGVLQYRDRAAQKQVMSPSYEAVAAPLHSAAIGRWKNYAHHLEPVLDELTQIAAELGYEP
jgi:tetratricopeptide (TPR) repeat protein